MPSSTGPLAVSATNGAPLSPVQALVWILKRPARFLFLPSAQIMLSGANRSRVYALRQRRSVRTISKVLFNTGESRTPNGLTAP